MPLSAYFIEEILVHRMNVIAVAAVVTLAFLSGFVIPASAQSVTAFEGARLIVGDGRVIENATLVVDGARIVQAGRAADISVPAGATRVSLAGKTVMPMLIDTHISARPATGSYGRNNALISASAPLTLADG
jgi:imidazolonepropionase-like amidohydrolase